MPTQLIQLNEEVDTLVEVEVPPDQATQISSRFARRVDATLEKLKPLLVNVCRPIAEAWGELNQDMHVDQAEVEIGFGFGAEGNLYITKSNASANITVRLTLKPKP